MSELSTRPCPPPGSAARVGARAPRGLLAASLTAAALLAAALLVVGCAGADDSGAGVEPDAGPGGDAPDVPTLGPAPIVDAGPIAPGGAKDTETPRWSHTPSDFGEPCAENLDCEAGWCVDAYHGKLCTQLCTENCPPGWLCAQVTNSFQDVTFVCLPSDADLCKPCDSDVQCGSTEDRCLTTGDGGQRYCATTCGEGAPCPDGFACTASGDGEPSRCRPLSGSCTCLRGAEGATRACTVSNEFGACPGAQVCEGDDGWSGCDAREPTAETCNGVDDDCNGLVDDGLTTAGCAVTNQWGSCAGQQTCFGAAGYICDAPTPLPEACNGQDDNCDGQIDEEGALGCTVYFKDADGDGVGDSADFKCLCAPQGWYTALVGGDCDDDDPNVGAADAVEKCTEPGEEPADENCDGQIDEPGAEGCQEYYADHDGDGFGVDGDAMCLCAPEAPYTALVGGDCDDTNPAINPAAEEQCNGQDDNCDGQIDEPGAIGCVPHYFDGDGDGYGIEEDSICACGPTGLYSALAAGDCDDQNNTVFPGAPEHCNGVDDDCNGIVDDPGAIGCQPYYQDADGDGFGDPDTQICTCEPPEGAWVTQGADCDDGNADVYPGAEEKCNGIDDNCNGLVDEEGAVGCEWHFADHDGDGFGVTTDGKCLCAPEAPYTAVMAGDCDDDDPNVNPAATEECNGKDDDCNGIVDDEGAIGCTMYYLDADGDGWGLSSDSRCLCGPQGQHTATQGGDCDDSDPAVGPGSPETCNGQDDDCNGIVDDPGAIGCTVYYADADGDGFGDASDFKCLCAPTEAYPVPWAGDCDDSDPSVNPAILQPCAADAECCDDQWVCVYGVCVPPLAPCPGGGACQNDAYCEDDECVPYTVGPEEFDPQCTSTPKTGLFNPSVKCAWTGPPPGDPYPNHRQVISTPAVADFDFDGDPETVRPSIVFVSYNGDDGGFAAASSNGIIRVIDGSTCELQHTISVATVVGAAPLAIGDLDLAPDGRPEIVAFREGGGMVAFRYDAAADFFQLHWVSTTKSGAVSTLASGNHRWNGPTLADVTGDAHPEILMGTVLHSHEGRILADNLGYRQLTGTTTGDFDVLADVDLDGEPELVLSDGIYRYAGDQTGGQWVLESYWTTGGLPKVFVAVADFGDYPVPGLPANIPELVLVGNGQARVVKLNGETIFGPYPLPAYAPGIPGYGGPPTIGDFDGDGRPEFATAAHSAYTVFDLDCVGSPPPLGCQSSGVLWTREIQDASSNRTGSSVFDFEADGLAEVVYADECYLRVYDGLTGDVLYSQSHSSCTWYENPVVADTDGDRRSEVVVGSNTNCNVSCPPLDPVHRGLKCAEAADCPSGVCVVGICRCTADTDCGEESGYACVDKLPNTPGQGKVCRAFHKGSTQGITVFQDIAAGWVNSRPIWNQHAYSITDVTDRGTIIPRAERVPNWLAPGLNNFRQNAQGEGDPTLTSDVTVGPGLLYDCDPSGALVIPVELCNRGAAPVDQGIPAAFFEGIPEGPDSKILCLEFTTSQLAPGQCEVLTCNITPADPDAPFDVYVYGDYGGLQGKASECNEDNNLGIFLGVSCKNLN